MRAAIEALAQGMDFADAVHLIGVQTTPVSEGFTNFDARFVKRALKRWPDLKILVA